MTVRATADNQNQLRFTAEHQPALQRRRVGRREWAAQFSDTEQVQWVRLPVGYMYQARFVCKYAKGKKIKDERMTKRTTRAHETPMWNRHNIVSANRKITKAESVGIQRSFAGKTVPVDAKETCGGNSTCIRPRFLNLGTR
jgi:hypothetical protein